MTDKTDKFTEELDSLIKEGDKLFLALQYRYRPEDFIKSISKSISEEKVNEIIKNLPEFSDNYQSWYSKSYEVIKQLLPDRLADFAAHYEYPKARKEISYGNYMIRDALQGLQISQYGTVKVDGAASFPAMRQQVNIIRAAKSALSSRLFQIRAILQADLFDSEVDSARLLAKNGYSRAAGAICGVVIEKHLLEVCSSHGLSLKKKIQA